MIKQLKESIVLDLIHLDGRLQNDDYLVLKNKISENTLFLLDDLKVMKKVS